VLRVTNSHIFTYICVYLLEVLFNAIQYTFYSLAVLVLVGLSVKVKDKKLAPHT